MARNLEVSIRIEMKETDDAVSGESAQPEATTAGHFRLVLDGADSLNIDAIEDGLLRTTYPALRDAMANHLSGEAKKNRIQTASYS
jgi:hypothetical protein